MAVYNVECFFNTGLSTDTAMDSLQLLRTSFIGKTYESVWLLQDRSLGQIKINAAYDDIKNCDYCIIGETGYHVLGIAMLNENVSTLVITCDYITTVGISNIHIIDGWCLRRSPTEDALFTNDIPEPFQPTEPLQLEIMPEAIDTGSVATSDYKIIISTVKLEATEYTADKYADATQDAFVLVPRVPVVTTPTTFYIGDIETGKKYELPVGAAYNYANSDVQKGVQAVRSLGIESCIQASYTIPANYVSLGSDEVGRHESVGGVDVVRNSQIKVEYTSVKNKKVFTGQFMKFGLASIASGSYLDYMPEDIVKDGQIEWRVMANPLPDGNPVAMPAYYKNSYNERLYGAVAGEKWQQNTLEYLAPSGSVRDYTRSQRGVSKAIVTGGATLGAIAAAGSSTFGAAVSAIPKIGKVAAAGGKAIGGKLPEIAAGSLLGFGSGAVDYFLDKAKEGLTAVSERKIREIMFRAPDYDFMPLESLQNFFGNNFIEYRVRLSDNDTERFDKFLTANGYAVSEPLKEEFFSSHKNFNFLTCEIARVKTHHGLLFDNAVSASLQNGVRIWHTAPSNDKLYNNPIKEV